MRPFQAFALTCCLPLAAAQQPPPTFQSTTKLVQLSVVAQGKNGQAIADLKREDFELLENGKPQSLAVFTTEREASATPPPTAPPGFYSNQFASGAAARSGYSVILLDWLNTPWADQAQSRQQLVRLLREIEPSRKVALYVLDRDSLRVIHDFTSDPAVLQRKLSRIRAAIPDPDKINSPNPLDASKSGREPLDDILPAATFRMKALRQDLQIRDTLLAFEAIADRLRGIPGRKSVIWLSAGFPLTLRMDVRDRAAQTYGVETDRAIRKLNNADVAVYPVDARGLSISPAAYINQGIMQQLADRSGGVAYINSNDIAGSTRAALEDGRVSYTLGYYPVQEKLDGKFREIRVKVGRPGVTLRYRRGYFAGEAVATNKDAAATARQEMLTAMNSPLDATGLPIAMRAMRTVEGIMMEIALDPAAVQLDQVQDRWKGAVEVMARFSADDSSVCGTPSSETMNMNLRRETYEQLLKTGISLRKLIPQPACAVSLRILARDSKSGTLGTLTVPLAGIPQQSGR
jgi:VWFA-related protein